MRTKNLMPNQAPPIKSCHNGQQMSSAQASVTSQGSWIAPDLPPMPIPVSYIP
jgi:hypothetical protein